MGQSNLHLFNSGSTLILTAVKYTNGSKKPDATPHYSCCEYNFVNYVLSGAG